MNELVLKNNNELPKGWIVVELESILSTLDSGSRPRGGVSGINQGILSIGGEHLDNNGGFDLETPRFIPEKFYQEMTKGHIQTDDILMVKDGATTGKTSFVNQTFPFKKSAVNEHVFILRGIETVIFQPYLFRYLFSNIGQKIIKSRVTGSAQGGINRSFIKNFVVPLPPLNEQKRIVEKIEELFSKLDFIIESLNKANLQLKQYHQKFLSDLLQGKILSMISIDNDIVELITRERNNLYKKEIEINESKKKVITPKQPVVLETGYIYNCPSHWAWFTLDSIINPIRGITYGVIKLGEHTENGVPCLRTSDVKPLKIDTTNVKTISKKIADKYKRTYLQGGEVLVNVRGTLGGVCTVPTDFAGYNISREIALVPILSVIPKKWIMYWISSAAVQNWLTKSSKGITYRGINLEDLRNLPICLPPLKEINRLVNEIEKHFSRINHTTQQLNNFENINKLKSKILKLAFEGKLIPQDPNDEPAEILLQKIKQEKQKIISQTSERKKHAR